MVRESSSVMLAPPATDRRRTDWAQTRSAGRQDSAVDRAEGWWYAVGQPTATGDAPYRRSTRLGRALGQWQPRPLPPSASDTSPAGGQTPDCHLGGVPPGPDAPLQSRRADQHGAAPTPREPQT